jgi:hypothetical protein
MKNSVDATILKNQAMDLFNHCWTYIEKSDRDDKDTREMISSAHASYWFWTQVPDHNATHESIGLWQIARVYALGGSGSMAALFARRCLEVSEAAAVDGFYRAYACEALARGLLLDGKKTEAAPYLARARKELADSAETETATLLQDLQELEKAVRA